MRNEIRIEKNNSMARKFKTAEKGTDFVPIQQLAAVIAEDSRVSGRTTFVPLRNPAGEKFVEHLQVNTYPETVTRILDYLKTLPDAIVRQLCTEHGVGTAPAQP